MALLRSGTAGDYVLEDSGLLDREGMCSFAGMYVAEAPLWYTPLFSGVASVDFFNIYIFLDACHHRCWWGNAR